MDIYQELNDDYETVETLYDLVFSQSRSTLSSYSLRENIPPVQDLCYVVKTADLLVAAIRYWPVYVEHPNTMRWPALLLGPIAVHPTFQGEGVGSMLIHHTLKIATQKQWARVFLVGNHAYYAKFGFTKILQNIIQFPQNTHPKRCLGKALVPQGLEGVSGRIVRYTDDTP